MRAGVDPGYVLDAVRRREIQSVQLEGDEVEVESVSRDRLEHDRRRKISLNRWAVLEASLCEEEGKGAGRKGGGGASRRNQSMIHEVFEIRE